MGSTDELKRHKMVEWLAPSVLARAAAEVVLSGLFANYSDKRENMGSLRDQVFHYPDADADGEFWFDYASDVGDGFDPTYRIAKAMSQPLEVGGHETRPGPLVLLGGDQVYPSASWQAYEERFKAPYAEAFPDPGRSGRRDLFAIPGNHDWYDGLTSFMRLFCQDSNFGGWQPKQDRSYFAIKLPNGWWLWGIDIQFDAYIDMPQIAYFTKVAQKTVEGDRIILATAKPSWIHVTEQEPRPQSWMSVEFFTERIVCANKAKLALTVTGDLHHYSRYTPTDPVDTRSVCEGGGDLITAGGGGAYLSSTHWLPETLSLPRVKQDEEPQGYGFEHAWPTRPESLKLRKSLLWHLLFWRTFSLNYLLFGLYALLALLLATGIRDAAPDYVQSLADARFWELLKDAVTPTFVISGALLLVALFYWARSGAAPGLVGLLHGVVQLVALVALTLFGLQWDPFDLADNGVWLGYVTAIAVGLIGCVLVARWILVLYLFLNQVPGKQAHANEVFAAQSRGMGTGFKHFLRFRIGTDGNLTIFPIAVESPDDVHLIESPIGVPRVTGSPTPPARP
jgi:hypothetical protein